MSDIMRTALKGSGSIRISIDMQTTGDIELLVTESWERLTAVERAAVPAERLEEAEDPDGVIREELTRLFRKAHLNWEAHKMAAEA